MFINRVLHRPMCKNIRQKYVKEDNIVQKYVRENNIVQKCVYLFEHNI